MAGILPPGTTNPCLSANIGAKPLSSTVTMKALLALIALLAAAVHLGAQSSFIVYAKGDYSLVTATVPATKPTDPARAAFLAATQADLAGSPAYETRMVLAAPPAPLWGKVLEGARGEFQFHDTFKGGFVVHLKLEGLTPGHTYRLCLNGNPKLAGNDRLADPVPGTPEERYMDFFTATADASGRYDATFAIALPAGPYDVRLYIKDTADYTVFLYHHYFRFTVE
jgi:hypothetical protein